MKNIKHFLNKILEISLFSIILIIPFSYKEVSFKWNIFLIFFMLCLVYLHFKQKRASLNVSNFGIIYAVLMMLLFNFAVKVDFIQQFKIPIGLEARVPLATILLSVGMLFFTMKYLFFEKLQVTDNYFAKYFLYSCLFLIFLMILFYPILFYHYRMRLDFNIQLLNHILEYLAILLLVTDYISEGRNMRRINFMLIVSISITFILSIFFK